MKKHLGANLFFIIVLVSFLPSCSQLLKESPFEDDSFNNETLRKRNYVQSLESYPSNALNYYNNVYDENLKTIQPYTYIMHKYIDIALDYYGCWNPDNQEMSIEELQQMLINVANANETENLENNALHATPADCFFDALYSAMLEEINSYPIIQERITEAFELSGEQLNDSDDMMINYGPIAYCKMDILLHAENHQPLEHEIINEEFLEDDDSNTAQEDSSACAVRSRAVRYTGFLIWPGNIKYRNFKNRCPNINRMREAMAEWEQAMQGRHFVQISDNGWNRFTWSIGCNYHLKLSKSDSNTTSVSSLGYVPWAYTYETIGALKPTYLHELGHTLGLLHEHQRPDRNNWIIVDYSNIKFIYWVQFYKQYAADTEGSFDFNSIMLYSSFSGVERDPSLPSMKKRDGGTFSRNQTISQQDSALIRRLYQ